MSQKIICPSCKTSVDLSKLSEEKYKKELEEEFEKEREDMRKKALEFADRKAREQAKKDALEMDDLKIRLKEQELRSEDMKKNELEMRKKSRELEEKEKNWELEMSKKMDIEKKKIEHDLEEKLNESSKKEIDKKMEKVQEEFRKKELEYQKQQDQLKKSLDDAKRKAEQWSQQIQWDIQEDDLKLALSHAFPIDTIEDVPTGVKWADLVQKVRNNLWQEVWVIVWESKNTKSWTDAWIPKLKDDKLKISWNIAILVTSVLPKDYKNFGFVDDVMVCLPEFAVSVAIMLRDKLLSISKIEKSLVWKDIKMELLYKYLRSEEFSSKINTMIDVFSKLKSDIDIERRSMEKIWKRREKELERALISTTMMYWELEWLMWQSLPWSEKLELGYWEEE